MQISSVQPNASSIARELREAKQSFTAAATHIDTIAGRKELGQGASFMARGIEGFRSLEKIGTESIDLAQAYEGVKKLQIGLVNHDASVIDTADDAIYAAIDILDTVSTRLAATH